MLAHFKKRPAIAVSKKHKTPNIVTKTDPNTNENEQEDNFVHTSPLYYRHNALKLTKLYNSKFVSIWLRYHGYTLGKELISIKIFAASILRVKNHKIEKKDNV